MLSLTNEIKSLHMPQFFHLLSLKTPSWGVSHTYLGFHFSTRQAQAGRMTKEK